MIVWGTGQPFAGAIADRFGTVRVLAIGAVLYCIGLSLMAYSTTPGDARSHRRLAQRPRHCRDFIHAGDRRVLEADAAAYALACLRRRHRRRLVRPVPVLAACRRLIEWFGWQHALVVFGFITLSVIPLALALRTPPMDPNGQHEASQQSLRHALVEAFGHRSYVLLVLGFFTCGFQLLFITVHLPAYLVDRGLSVDAGGWTLGTIGLFNIVGSITSGYLGNRMPKRYLLSVIYTLRSLAVVVFISLPMSNASAICFGAVMGLLWLSTVPPTSGLVALMFGTRWMATLFGFAFFSHQVGGFLGVWLGGLLYTATGSYNLVWWLSVAFGIVSAIINLPIIERPIERLAPIPV